MKLAKGQPDRICRNVRSARRASLGSAGDGWVSPQSEASIETRTIDRPPDSRAFVDPGGLPPKVLSRQAPRRAKRPEVSAGNSHPSSTATASKAVAGARNVTSTAWTRQVALYSSSGMVAASPGARRPVSSTSPHPQTSRVTAPQRSRALPPRPNSSHAGRAAPPGGTRQRVCNGQQNADRRIPSGRNPGGGAQR